jgi:predicted DNA-binding WGR domain protein
MPRYEFKEGTSNKFWEITLDGTAFTTKYGKIGTDGQETVKEWDDEDKAKKEYDKLVAEKVKKGYKLVGNGGGATAKATPVAKKAAVFEDEGDDDEAEDQDHVATTPMKMPAKAASGGGDGKKRHFEFVEGTSSKFWEISLDGSAFTTRYGRIGTPGQETVKDYGTAEKAKKEYEKLVAEKVKKGYVEK